MPDRNEMVPRHAAASAVATCIQAHVGKHDDDVYVTSHLLRTACHGAEHERNADAIGEGGKGSRELVRQPRCLAENARDLFEHRAAAIGAIDHLIPARLAFEQANLREAT